MKIKEAKLVVQALDCVDSRLEGKEASLLAQYGLTRAILLQVYLDGYYDAENDQKSTS